MKKLIFLLSIFAIVLSCSSDETSTPVTPPPAPIVKYTITLSAGEGGTVTTTGGEYEAGQTVSVTATPQGEYVFTNWSDGNTNATRTITVSSNSTLTANFEKRKYPLTINIEGEGEVLEEIVNAGRTTEYNSGTTVKLTAQAAAERVFVGWTGDIESTDESVQIVIGESKEVTVTFENNPFSVTHIPDYSKPSYYTRIPFPQNVKTGTYREFSNWHPPLEAVVLDYNKDGYLDIIDNQSDYGVFTRNNILFLQGTSSGKLEIDSNNSYKHPGLIHGRKGLTGDYNGDGWPDVFFIGHGYDLQDDNPRNEYPIMLLNNQGKDFEYRAFESVVGFFHTGASGDIDNDGDLDILLIDGTKGVENSYIFINDGTGDFLAVPLDQYQSIPSDTYDSFFQKWTVELNDIDNNGYLDIIIAGAPDTYGSTPPTILLNSSNGFTSKIELPKEPVYKLVVDIDFYDFDGDGIDELILNRTPLNYISYKVTIHSLTTDEDLTTTYFNNNDFTGQTSDKWMYWISIIEKDGELYLKGDDMYTPHQWIFEDGKFKKTIP